MLRPIFIHCKPTVQHDLRYDSLMMVNASVAYLNSIAKALLGYPGISIDETYVSENAEGRERELLLNHLRGLITAYLSAGDEPIVFCTLLSYNAGPALQLLHDLKQEFTDRVRTGVGGQLVRVCPTAYLTNPDIDHVGVGDAEVILSSLLLGKQRFAQGYKRVTPHDHYAEPLYENYLSLDRRLDEMSRYRLGPFSGVRQLVTESVRGCAWASAYKVCRFCSLQGVDTWPVFRALKDHFRIEQHLAEHYGLNWIFDTSNQWLPTVNTIEICQWLRDYVKQRQVAEVSPINRYVYLTSNSVNHRTAPLLREAGVRIAYVGIDGWDKLTRAALHKAQVDCMKMLRACADNDIFVRTSMVIGSGLTTQNLKELPQFEEQMLNEFGGKVILSLGNFLEILLPGSADWEEFEREAHQQNIEEAIETFSFFRSHGYLSLDQEDRLNELRIKHTQRDVSLEEVLLARDKAVETVKRSLALSVTIRESEQLERPARA